MTKPIKPFKVNFKKVYSMFMRKELNFLGVYIDKHTLWIPIEYEKDKPRIRIYNNDTDFGEIIQNILLWRIPTLLFMGEIVSFIRKENGELNKYKQIDHSICTKCGGKCCKNSGCYYSIRDFKEISLESLVRQLMKGYTSIVGIEGEFSGYENSLVLKVRNIGQAIIDIETPVQSPCILLTESGCMLKDEQRPYGGKALIPQKDHSCIIGYTLREAVEEWLPYQGLLFQLSNLFFNKDIPFKRV